MTPTGRTIKSSYKQPIAFVFYLIQLGILFGCSGVITPISGTPALTSTITVLSEKPSTTSTHTPIPTKSHNSTQILTPTRTATPTITPTFNPVSLATVTRSSPALCPRINAALVPQMPKKADHPADLLLPILEALNNGTPFNTLQEALGQMETPYGRMDNNLSYQPTYYSDKLIRRDLTGDGVPEIIYSDWDWLSIFACEGGSYTQIFQQKGTLAFQIKDIGIQDLNGDELPEVFFRLYDAMPVNGQYLLYIYTWVGAKYKNTVVLNKEDYEEIRYPGTYPHGHATNITAVKNEPAGTHDLVIRGTIICSPCTSAGPFRWFTDVFTWNGSGFVHLPKRFDPPVYRFQAVQDGDLETWRGNYALAMEFYDRALEDETLKGWSEELYQQQEDIVRAEGSGLPTPTALPGDPNEYEVLSAYIHYRKMLLHAVQGDFEDVRKEYEAIQAEVQPGHPGYDFVTLATVFWNAYEGTRDLSAACVISRGYASDHYEEIFTPIDDTWHGWQSPGHMRKPSDEELICPFE